MGAPTVSARLREAARRLRAAGIGNAEQEARWLLDEALGDPAAGRRFADLVARRVRREPLQHVLGHWPFLELDLRCDGRALVPRPETEDLAERARERLRGAPAPRLAADVGTGGGCLALALASAVDDARVVATDVDPRALELAADNRDRLGLGARVGCVLGHLLDPVGPSPGLALVVANLPYVTEREWAELEPEVRVHDPKQALVAADGGLALIRELIEGVGPRLRPDGALMLELAPSQMDRAQRSLVAAGFRRVKPWCDRFGRDRFLIASDPAVA